MKLEPKDNEDIEIDMSPMIDMVFLLLIFFLVASTVIDEKIKIEEIPTAVHANIPPDRLNRVVVSINRDEEIFFGINQKPITLDELEAHLSGARIEDEKLRVMIRCDGGVKYEVNEKIMAVCGKAGAMDLIYAAFEGGGDGS